MALIPLLSVLSKLPVVLTVLLCLARLRLRPRKSISICFIFVCFFFQAEDGIRDLIVTGVQTCALPISTSGSVPGTNFSGSCGRAVRRTSCDSLRGTDGAADPIRRDIAGSSAGSRRRRALQIGRASCRERV